MTTFRQIRADYDDHTLVVYQAYRPEIAAAAVAAQRLVSPFSLSRMTWAKPSFLWMMERCGWATKVGQEHVLKIRITRTGWESALREAQLTGELMKGAAVQVQWDPERDVLGRRLDHRSIQVGLSGAVVKRYVREWTVGIEDITQMVSSLRELRSRGELDQIRAQLPTERPYPLDEELQLRLRVHKQSAATGN